MADKPKPEQDEKGRFIAGNSGNGGRPKGARAKLGEAFCQAMQADFEDHGVEVIEKVRSQEPAKYLKLVADMLPKEMNIKVSEFDDLTDDQLARQLAAIASQLAGAGIALDAGIGSAAQAQSAVGVSTLQ